MLSYATNLLLATTLVVAGAVANQHTPAPSPVVMPSQAADGKPVNIPEWKPRYGVRFAGCAKSLPGDVIPSRVVVVELTGDVTRMDFDHATRVTHNDNRADDVWVVGACR